MSHTWSPETLVAGWRLWERERGVDTLGGGERRSLWEREGRRAWSQGGNPGRTQENTIKDGAAGRRGVDQGRGPTRSQEGFPIKDVREGGGSRKGIDQGSRMEQRGKGPPRRSVRRGPQLSHSVGRGWHDGAVGRGSPISHRGSDIARVGTLCQVQCPLLSMMEQWGGDRRLVTWVGRRGPCT